MHAEWLATEHYRLHVIERWPNGPSKNAGLAAARSSLEGLLRAMPSNESTFTCAICGGKRERATVIEYPQRPPNSLMNLNEKTSRAA